MRRHLSRLNPEQRRAVEKTEGPLLVLAGAGTGKTRVITVRIAYLLSRGVEASRILAMTFTNKAAAEMRSRVSELVGEKRAADLTVGTFHAFCMRTLRKHAAALDLPQHFAICDSSDQLAAVKGALRELCVPEAQLPPRQIHSRISLLKNQLVTPAQFLERAVDGEDELVGRVYRMYEEHLRRARSLDFDDLLVKTVELVRDRDAIRASLQARFHYLLVDEFQDTNQPQYEVVRRIAGDTRNLCVVGDDDQSIYGWRGADVSKILDFAKHFPGAVTVRLETNYRSTEPILDAANAVIANNPARHDKRLRSHLGPGEPIRFVTYDDEVTEAESAVFDVIGKRLRHGLSFADVAILFRTAPQARVFETALRANDIPYVLVGGMSFFDRKEVRDLLAFVKLMVNPQDEVSFLRVVNTPPRGVGKGTLDKLLDLATRNAISVPAAIERQSEIEGLNPSAMAAIRDLRATLAKLADGAVGPQLVRRLRSLIEQVDYDIELVRCYPDPETRAAREAAIAEFFNMVENYVRRAATGTLAGLLETIALATADDRPEADDKGRDAVTLMTLHAAKGLEFPHVYLVGMEEGLLPHVRSVAEDTVEEERRLAYVGVTRAQRRLTVSYAATRARYGKRIQTSPSRFIFEMQRQSVPKGWWPAGGSPPEPPPTKKGRKRKSSRGRGRARSYGGRRR